MMYGRGNEAGVESDHNAYKLLDDMMMSMVRFNKAETKKTA